MGFAFIDIKTTGKSSILDKICFISISTFDSNLNPKISFSTWVNPDIKVSDKVKKLYGIKDIDFEDYPTFEGIKDQVYKLIKNNTLGSFDSDLNVLEFLIEELFQCDIDFKYKKKDFIVVKEVENYIFKRTLASLSYKYLGRNVGTNTCRTKLIGDIFKKQCEFLNTNPKDFKYSEKVDKEIGEISNYISVIDGEEVINFGKYKGFKLDEVPKRYLEWISNNDFPLEFVDKVKCKLNNYGEFRQNN